VVALGERAVEVASALRGRSVLVTGHTGFKGSWLTLVLHQLGARVSGLSLPPPTTPSHFEVAGIEELMAAHTIGDVRDRATIEAAIAGADLIFHLAAQPLVRESYRVPLDTFAINVLGTANLLDVVRARPCPVVVVTSDKCYEENAGSRAYREDDKLGGHDPYSASKAAAELVAASYRRSFGLRIATARAGNVIGGGDWARDRIVVDAMEALLAGRPIPVRNPRATRPFQHVLDPVHGYLCIAAALLSSDACASAWNLGPDEELTVQELVERMIAIHGSGSWVDASDPTAVHEAPRLRLDATRARTELGWAPRFHLEEALKRTVSWYQAWSRGDSMRARSLDDLAAYGPPD